MEYIKMNNMVIVKNPPSNLVEEAIVIFKSANLIKEKELIDKKMSLNSNNDSSNKDKSIVIEAERLVNDYIDNIEKQKSKINLNKMEKRDKILKLYNIILSLILIISLVINFI